MRRLFLFIFLAMVITAKGQNVFFDAKKIADSHPQMINGKVSIAENDEVFEILRNYVSKNDTNAHLIGTTFEDNPFISVSIPAGGANILARGNLFSSIGGLDVTNIADGLAQFLIERGKEELNIAFF